LLLKPVTTEASRQPHLRSLLDWNKELHNFPNPDLRKIYGEDIGTVCSAHNEN
jgi:hypothetical protein